MGTELMLEPKLEGKKDALTRELTYWRGITSQNEADSAIELCLDGKALVKDIKAFCAPNKAKWHDGWKAACNQENELIGQVETEVKRVQKLVDDYRTAEFRKAQEAERARQQKERAAAMEQQRIEAEAALKRAAELESQGRNDLAEKVLEKAEAIAEAAPAIVEPVKVEVAKTAGLGTRMVWDFEVEDLSKVPLEYMQLNESKVKAMIKFNDIAGIRRFERVASSLRG